MPACLSSRHIQSWVRLLPEPVTSLQLPNDKNKILSFCTHEQKCFYKEQHFSRVPLLLLGCPNHSLSKMLVLSLCC